MSGINQYHNYNKGLNDTISYFKDPVNHTEKKDNLISTKEIQDAIKNPSLSREGQIFLEAVLENNGEMQKKIMNIEPYDKEILWGLNIDNEKEISIDDLKTLEIFTDGDPKNDKNKFRIKDRKNGSATPCNKDTDKLANIIREMAQGYIDLKIPSESTDNKLTELQKNEIIEDLGSVITPKTGKYINEFSEQDITILDKALNSIGITSLIPKEITPTGAGKKQDIVNRLMKMLDIQKEINIRIGPKTIKTLTDKLRSIETQEGL